MYTSHLAKQLTRPKRKTRSLHTGMHSSHPAKTKFTRTNEKHTAYNFKIYRHVQFVPSEGKIYSHTAYNFKKYTGMYSSHTAKEKFTRTQREAHSLQFEKYTGMYSSHTAKEKFTRTQREAHSLQLEKYTGMYSSHTAKEKFTRTQLTI